ncbi:MAG: thioredoxin domain-containing protein [Halobacteriaceae archaeon]
MENRLDEESSPYLRQHADNPVHWQPWDSQALSLAQERDVPIFLSVGYSACHWCHVMEEESFQDEEIAKVLNNHFVPIKVDREERPDVDRIYMAVCQQVTGHGGWPLSAWLTPDGRPFYVGTYFPPEPQQGQPGFKQLLEEIHNSWETDREQIEQRADQWSQMVSDTVESVPQTTTQLDSELIQQGAESIAERFDASNGGFGGAPKFPQSRQLRLLMQADYRTDDETYRHIITETLSAMAQGGLRDYIGGGFHRYATDEKWMIPHFEKMLYDNAELAQAYIDGYQVTNNELYRDVVQDIFTFIESEMTHDGGAFYSSIDARSEGEEGAYYVWTPDEISDAIETPVEGFDTETLTDLVTDRFGVTQSGNFEGQTVLHISSSVASLAESYNSDTETIENALTGAKQQLAEARDARVKPRTDTKILTDWNGLMIIALARGGWLFTNSYIDQAKQAYRFIKSECWEDILYHRYKDGESAVVGYLSDYAFLSAGALTLYEVTGDHTYLLDAIDLVQSILDAFWDPSDETLYETQASESDLIARPQELSDQSLPSSVGIACQLLIRLDPFVTEDFDNIATTILQRHGEKLTQSSFNHPTLLADADLAQNSLLEIIPAGDLPAAFRTRLTDKFLPDSLLAWRPDEDNIGTVSSALHTDSVPIIWKNRTKKDGQSTLYICRQSCSPPLTEPSEIQDWIDSFT